MDLQLPDAVRKILQCLLQRAVACFQRRHTLQRLVQRRVGRRLCPGATASAASLATTRGRCRGRGGEAVGQTARRAALELQHLLAKLHNLAAEERDGCRRGVDVDARVVLDELGSLGIAGARKRIGRREGETQATPNGRDDSNRRTGAC